MNASGTFVASIFFLKIKHFIFINYLYHFNKRLETQHFGKITNKDYRRHLYKSEIETGIGGLGRSYRPSI